MSTSYLVRWETDIEADSPQEAAEKALRIHRNPESTATVFLVCGGENGAVTIDLTPDTDD